MDEKKVNLLNKLIALYNHDRREPKEPNILHYITQLAHASEDYQPAMQVIEAILDTGVLPQNLPAPSDKPWFASAEAIYQIALKSAPIRTLLATASDRLSSALSAQVLLFVQIADLIPNPNLESSSMLYSADHTLMRVLEFAGGSPVLSLENLTANDMFREDLLKFIDLYEEYPIVAEKLATLARSIHWHTVLVQLETELTGDKPTENLTSEALGIWREWQVLLTPDLLAKLFSSPHLLAMSQDLIAFVGFMTFKSRSDISIIDKAKASLGVALQPDQLTQDQRKLLATTVFELLNQLNKPYLETISTEAAMRIEVAQHCLEVRQFAKLDAFVYKWPEIARLAMTDYASLEDVERYVVQGITTSPSQFFTPKAKYLFERCVQDEVLISFLRLRPYFMNMDEKKLVQYRPVPPIVIDEPDINKFSMPNSPLPIEMQNLALQNPAIQNPAILSPTPSYQQVIIRLRPIPQLESTSLQAIPLEQSGYTLEIDMPAGFHSDPRTLSAQTLQEKLDILLGAPLSEEWKLYLNDPTAKSDVRLADQLAKGGAFLSQEIFGAKELETLSKALSTDRRTRFILETEAPELIQLPWEWLTAPDRRVFVTTDRSYSLVRTLPSLQSITSTPLIAPPRILAVLPGVDSLGAQNAREMTEFFSQTLPTRGAGTVNILAREHTTPANLAQNIAEVKPSVLHIEPSHVDWTAHVEASSMLPSTDTPALVLTDQTNKIYWVGAQALWDMLQKAGVSLVVFGSNPYADVSINPLLQLVLALIRAGLPAAVVPLRQVDDTSSHLFVQEFYRSLVRGRQLEVAITDARTKLFDSNHNWSTFALFANPSALEVAVVS